MEVVFYIVLGLIIAGVLVVIAGFLATGALIGHAMTQEAAQRQRAWGSGLTAQGRCLRVFTTTSGGRGDFGVRTTLHHVYEFTARNGRVVRFEESHGPATTVEGDVVTVYYAERAEEAATTRPPERASNTTGTVKLLAGGAMLLVVLAIFAVLCVGFKALTYRSDSPADHDTVICYNNTCHTGPNPFPDLIGRR